MWRWIWSWGLLLCAVIAHAAGEVIAVSDFLGKPAEIGQEIAETLGTDLAKSERITLVERSQLGQALRELRLQSTGLTEPAQARKVGKLVGADAIIVGSFYLRGHQIVINARVVDVRTGKVMAGRAENVQGKFSDLYHLLGDMANRLHVRLTGQELASVEPSLTNWGPASVRIADAQDDPEILYVVQQGWMQGTPDGYFLPDKPVTVGDFARVLFRIANARRWEGKLEMDTARPSELLSALRAVVVLTRLALPPDAFPEIVPVDLAPLPIWARPYVFVALKHGYVRDVQEVSPERILVRRQLASLLVRIAPPPPQGPLPGAVAGDWTGLIVDARGLGMRSSMSPVIKDANNRQIYPDRKNLPPPQYILEYGIADFVKMEQQAKRTGDNPVYVRAVRVEGAGKDTVVIGVEDAERTLDADKRSRFLKYWRVVFLVD